MEPGDVDAAALARLRQRASRCRDCPLWEHATQTVLGEGPAPASMLLVGEQPGDREDRTGRPFVGPAGHLLDRALEAAGIARGAVFLSNVVKHFKWTPRGKRRLHSKPSQAEMDACRPWLDAEIVLVRPSVIVCLGATAARSILGPGAQVRALRGTPIPSNLARYVVVTIHPSAVIRMREPDARRAEMDTLVADLRQARALVNV